MVPQRLRRAVVRLTSAGLLAGLAAGIPAALTHYVGWPLPRHIPTDPNVWLRIINEPFPDTAVINLLAVALWITWALFCWDLAAELAAALSGRHRQQTEARSPRRLTPTRALAALLVAGLATGGASTAIAAISPPVAAVAPAVPGALVAAAPTGGQPTAGTWLSITTDADGTGLRAVPAAHTTTLEAVTAGARETDLPRFAAVAHTGPLTVATGDQHYTVTVARGDTLWDLARTWLGDPHRWPEIYHLNADRYDHAGRMRGGDHIEPAWVLVLPDDATPPAGAQSADPSPRTAPAQPSDPTAEAPTAPTPSAPSAAAPSAVAPSQAETVTPTPTRPADIPTATAPQEQPGADTTHTNGSDQATIGHEQGFVEVVGGFVSVALAAGLVFAAGMVWRRRRHRYRPTPVDAVVLDDPDLAPPLAALTHLRQTLRRHRPQVLDTPTPGPTVREYNAAEVKPPLPQVGPTGTDLAGVGHLPVAAGLGLDGPGALDAARGLLVASLTAGSPDTPDAQGQVVIPAATLATLLGVSAVDLPRMRRLTVTANTSDAITQIEEEIIRRTRIVTDHDAENIAELRDAHPLAEPLPQLLFIGDVPEPRQHQRLANAIHLGEKVDLGAALIGTWPLGVTLTVATDGTATGDATTPRVAVLDTDAATAVLTMLAEAHGDRAVTSEPDSGLRASASARAPVAAADGRVSSQRPEPSTPLPVEAEQPDRVRVRVLGTPVILDPTGRPMHVERRKAVELLVYLAVHRNGAALPDIMEALWPDATCGRASERLSTCVGSLRGVLRAARPTAADSDSDDGVPRRNGKAKAAEPIPNTGSRYHLDPGFVRVDWWTVLDEYTQVATADTADARRRHLLAAVAAISGPLAEGQEYDWVDTDREHVRRHLIKLYAHAAQLHEDDDPHQARLLYDSACQLDPLSDELARRAMRAAAAVGDADGIRHRLGVLRQALEDNSLDMDDTTEQVATDLLRQLAPPHRADQ